MANSTEQRKQVTENTMRTLEQAMSGLYPEIYFTGDNTNTITFIAGEVNGEPVYGSIKFTLHKGWNEEKLEEEVNKYFVKLEERELKAKVAAQKKADKERKIAVQKEKAAKRQAQADLDKARTQKSIANLKVQLGEKEDSVEE
jgi:hypothetical protein